MMKKRNHVIYILILLLFIVNVFNVIGQGPPPPPVPAFPGETTTTTTDTKTDAATAPTLDTLEEEEVLAVEDEEGPPPFTPSGMGTTPTPTPKPATTPTPTPTPKPATTPTSTPKPVATPTPTPVVQPTLPRPPAEEDTFQEKQAKQKRAERRLKALEAEEATATKTPVKGAPIAGVVVKDETHDKLIEKIDRLDKKIDDVKTSVSQVNQAQLSTGQQVTQAMGEVQNLRNRIDAIVQEISEVPKRIEIPRPPDISPITRTASRILITIIVNMMLVILILVIVYLKLFKKTEEKSVASGSGEADVEQLRSYFEDQRNQGMTEEEMKEEALKIGWTEKEIEKAL